jgi:hypothetical protein
MNLLADSSNSLIGGLYLILMFLFCFSAVYVAKAVYYMINNIKLLQIRHNKKMPMEEEKQQPEKIYYLVERKKAPVRRKVSSEPKRIYFSEK